MDKWTQRIRGAIGIGVAWAAGWAAVGVLTGLLLALGLDFPLAIVIRNYATTFGMLGFFGGVIFSLLLSLAEGKRKFDQLSVPRFAVWGALGGLTLGGLAVGASLFGSGITGLGAVVAGAATLLGAGSAAGTLVVARGPRGTPLPRGDAAARELLETR